MSSISCEHTQRKKTGPRKKARSVDILTAPTFLGIPKKKFHAIIDELPVYLWMHDENYTIVHTNNRFNDKYGDDCIGKLCHRSIMKSDYVCDCCISGDVLKSNHSKKCSGCSCEGANKNTHTFHRPFTRKNGSKYVLKSTIVMDNVYSYLNEFEDKKESPDEDISSLLWSMCSWCKKIKDDKSNWINLESFLIHYFNIVISHGICPDCIEKLYPSMEKQ
jgi:hypothetical protein